MDEMALHSRTIKWHCTHVHVICLKDIVCMYVYVIQRKHAVPYYDFLFSRLLPAPRGVGLDCAAQTFDLICGYYCYFVTLHKLIFWDKGHKLLSLISV